MPTPALFSDRPPITMSSEDPRRPRPASEALPSSTRPSRRSRTSSDDEEAFVLPNGICLHDRAPGKVTRYKHLTPGGWQAARILIYSFSGFPDLRVGRTSGRAGSTGAGTGSSFGSVIEINEATLTGTGERSDPIGSKQEQYAWKNWLQRVKEHPKNIMGFRECAIYLTQKHETSLSDVLIADVAKAVIELVFRDAEFARMGCKPCTTIPVPPTELKDESTLMSRIRTAQSYKPRSQGVEESILQAIHIQSSDAMHRMAASASDDHHIHALMDQNRL